ncbi:flagellar protein FlgN [Pelosinus sp. UFO1]|uniref:flagellar protein FlgN n=1 Tax=Pelosinus sp. UFO1 TaxID=484770 RepID=UPI0004D1A05F|nr:flagellar protein FlgN [Pelosinus sp. UFO1]AIF53662.1 FlgN family protein [Pelosinus sp. UFO1]
MKEKWEKLIAVFEKLLMLYQEILGLSVQKRDILVQNNVKDLEKNMKQEENLLFQVTKFDRIRKSMIKDLAVMYGLPDKEATLSGISQVADQDLVSNLNDIKNELQSVILKIAEVNDVNKKLVEQGLLIVNYSLNLLAQSSVGPTYHPNEKNSFVSPNKAMFDSKV